MHFDISDPSRAGAAIEYFNAFHDGFIRRFSVESDDEFEDRHTHRTTGPLRVEICFAHNNYGEGRPPIGQLVRARFFGVRDLEVSFTGRPTDWPINRLCLEPPTTTGESVPTGLRARLLQPRLVEERRWEHAEALSFSFDRAEILEVQETDES